MGVDITISTRQGAYFAGEVIEGAVHVNVAAVRYSTYKESGLVYSIVSNFYVSLAVVTRHVVQQYDGRGTKRRSDMRRETSSFDAHN